ncbi:MAG TPA: TolC family protein, partial [Geobacterales bacterium]|nr:TolC family protein [Geobacterales bacterium]
QQRLAAANGLTKARMHLALAVGRGGGEQLDAGEPLTPPQLTYGTDELVQLALANRQDLKELEAEQRRAEAGVTTSRSALLPSLYGSATYQMNAENTPFGRDNDSWMAGATLRWDLFNGGSRWNDKERAQAMNRSVQEQVALYREQVKLQVHEGVLQRDEAESRLEMTKSAAEEAEEGARLVQLRYENSLATMVELLDAQMAVNRARAQLVEASADQALATGELYHTAGIFLKEVVQ